MTADIMFKGFDLQLEQNGVVRRAVFPNSVRQARKNAGFATLREIDGKTNLNYTRLLKIERGEVFPTADELKAIAVGLDVPVGELLIDETEPDFDRDAWAREHIEAKLENRGGSINAMRLGAAVRVKRQLLGLSTSHLTNFGLSAATVSRIENADRPIERWDATVQRGIAKVLGARNDRQSMKVVNAMYEQGELDETLSMLFSPTSIKERNRKRLRALLAELPGTFAAQMLGKMGGAEVKAVRSLTSDILAVSLGVLAEQGAFKLAPSSRTVATPAGAGSAAFAVEMGAAVLGPGLPKGWVVVADPERRPVAGDVVVVRDEARGEVRVLATADQEQCMIGFSLMSDTVIQLNALPAGLVLAKVVSMIA